MHGKVDNSDLLQKIRIRSKIFEYDIKIESCLEYFSGKGVLREAFWNKICEKVFSIDIENTGTHLDLVSDSFKLAELSVNYQIIDCDAYGVVLPFVAKMAKMRNSPQIYFFTDGGEVQNKHKPGIYSVEDLVKSMQPTDYKIETSSFANRVKYGLIYFDNAI